MVSPCFQIIFSKGSTIDPEFDNYGACMRLASIKFYFVLMTNAFFFFQQSVSEDLLCAFELLKPLDGAALRKEMTKAKRKRYVKKNLIRSRTNILHQCNGYCFLNLCRVKLEVPDIHP